ncbi:MAG: 2-amino-4-hydroxy-6-hydroxymethyldihydropteridine diphosphokinase [Spirochaetales bacterium]|nr:2-amino-4-hydroxy-6-hydroxymethyldihydropteridine diphosphokinase [Spirochaetales bacterium]
MYLGLGSNIGDREAYLRFAFQELQSLLTDLKVSRVYESEPMYVTDQARFLNAVAHGFTDMEPFSFLKAVLDLEDRAGRVRRGVIRRGPRVLDVDVLLFGDRLIDTPRLTCPHPLMKERIFVLLPLLELSPDCKEPGTNIHYQDYLNTLLEQGENRKIRLFHGS